MLLGRPRGGVLAWAGDGSWCGVLVEELLAWGTVGGSLKRGYAWFVGPVAVGCRPRQRAFTRTLVRYV